MIKKFIFLPIIFLASLTIGATGALTYKYYLQHNRPPTFLTPEAQVLSAESSAILEPSKLTTSNLQPTTESNYEIIGFLPYWLINQSDHLQYKSLTQIAYFGIEFDQNGQLKTHLEDGSRELGLHRLRTNDTLNQVLSQTQNPNLQNTLVVKILNNKGIEAAISPQNRQHVITTILQFITDYSFTNINIDFEYIRPPSENIKTQFTEFIKILNQKLKNSCQMPARRSLGEGGSVVSCQLSIDIYADTGLKQPQRLWQLSDLSPHVDHFIVMGYDFHRTTSPRSGPIAPIRGAPLLWDDDLTSSIRAISRLVPSRQIILGVPFYGYEWDTYTDQPTSASIKGTGRLATYSRIQNLLSDCGILPLQQGELKRMTTKSINLSCTLNFDPEALSPYLIYKNGEYPNQIWYEDTLSLKYKLQLIKQANLGGIAIWALGYESPYTDLWVEINKLNQ